MCFFNILKSTNERLWNEKYRELVVFHKVFAHSDVLPSQDKDLHRWCKTQRDHFTDLSRDRQRMLMKVAFRVV